MITQLNGISIKLDFQFLNWLMVWTVWSKAYEGIHPARSLVNMQCVLLWLMPVTIFSCDYHDLMEYASSACWKVMFVRMSMVFLNGSNYIIVWLNECRPVCVGSSRIQILIQKVMEDLGVESDWVLAQAFVDTPCLMTHSVSSPDPDSMKSMNLKHSCYPYDIIVHRLDKLLAQIKMHLSKVDLHKIIMWLLMKFFTLSNSVYLGSFKQMRFYNFFFWIMDWHLGIVVSICNWG